MLFEGSMLFATYQVSSRYQMRFFDFSTAAPLNHELKHAVPCGWGGRLVQDPARSLTAQRSDSPQGRSVRQSRSISAAVFPRKATESRKPGVVLPEV